MKDARYSAGFVYAHPGPAADKALAEIADVERERNALAAARASSNGMILAPGSHSTDASTVSDSVTWLTTSGGTAALHGSPQGPPPTLFTAANRRALTAALGVVTLQQVTGQPSILYYAAAIFKDAGMSSYAAVLTGAFKLLATMVSVMVVDKNGRRWLLLLGITIMFFALVMMTVAFYGYEPAEGDDDGRSGDDDAGINGRTAVIITGMFLYIGGYQISFGPIAWLLISEVFATDVRDSAIAVAVQCNFAWNLLVSFGYPILVQGLGALLGTRYMYCAAFGIFGALTLYSIYFVYVYVPETKGLTLEEIERFLRPGGGHSTTWAGKSTAAGSGCPTHARSSNSIARSLAPTWDGHASSVDTRDEGSDSFPVGVTAEELAYADPMYDSRGGAMFASRGSDILSSDGFSQSGSGISQGALLHSSQPILSAI